MTHATDALPRAPVRAETMGAPSYRAEATRDVERFLADAALLQHEGTLPFLHPTWLRAWYATLGAEPGVRPLLVTVRDGQGRPLVLLPMVCLIDRGLRVATFADRGVVDYVHPLVAADWACGASEAVAARALWKSVRPLLAGCDLLHVDKMLKQPFPEMACSANPLVLALPTLPSVIGGNSVSVTTSWDDWRQSLGKRTRKELERSQRVFERLGTAPRFECADTVERALTLFTALERQQSERLRHRLGERYVLDSPVHGEFHRRVIRDGLADGSVFLTALTDGDDVVSALFGVANAHRSISLRQSVGLERWSACSPGRLLHERTGRHMHSTGREHFDLGIGDYFHKRVLHMQTVELVDTMVPLTLRGRPRAALWSAHRRLRQSAWGERWRARRKAAEQRSAAQAAPAPAQDSPAGGSP